MFIMLLSPDEAARCFKTDASRDAITELEFYRQLIDKEIGHRPPVQLSWGTVDADQDCNIMSYSIYFKYLAE